VDRRDEAERLARVYVWWQEPALAVAAPQRLLRQILRLGRPEDYVLAEEIWGRAALRQAFLDAGPGEIDRKSARFWRLRFELPESTGPERG